MKDIKSLKNIMLSNINFDNTKFIQCNQNKKMKILLNMIGRSMNWQFQAVIRFGINGNMI